jgi:tripartite-type tricarboxylate transporter receptor subunit TctC
MHSGIVAALLMGAASFVITGDLASAQNFPTKSVTLIVPWPAGGVTDIAMRALAAATSRHLGHPIIIENRPGAGGTLGPMQMAATAKPDGYTVTQVPLSLLRVASVQKTTFDPATDLTYIIGLTSYTLGVVVRTDSPWMTFRQLLADAKAHPGKIRYGTAGTGTTPHVTMTRVASQQRIDWIHVPFKGSSEVTNAILGGHIDAAADAASLGHTGTLRLLVTWGAHRSTNWPTVPTLRETGIDLVENAPYGLAGPKGMDPKIVQVLHDAFKKGLEEPQFAAALRTLDQEPFYMSTQDYHDFVMQQLVEQKQLIEELGLKRD